MSEQRWRCLQTFHSGAFGRCYSLASQPPVNFRGLTYSSIIDLLWNGERFSPRLVCTWIDDQGPEIEGGRINTCHKAAQCKRSASDRRQTRPATNLLPHSTSATISLHIESALTLRRDKVT